ncbi:hypothetical protein Taro_005491 [Colocasia esculenta]|uniref:Uncharacterized protein n=1 Tax=Colocasia esculenta TaxID=4460 RepID=A0A843TQ08_COLES|nr:hypothetical protein [Colocasia esculenta]
MLEEVFPRIFTLVLGLGIPEVKARRTSLDRRPVQSRVVAVQGQYLQQCSSSSIVVVVAM